MNPSASFAHDMRRFADNLEIRNFQALSAGLGLGELRPIVHKSSKQLHSVRSKAFESESGAERLAREAIVNKVVEGLPREAGPVWERRILAWGVDFVFVATTLVVAVVLASVVSAMRSGTPLHSLPINWLNMAPIKWLGRFSPVDILGGIYAIYLSYALLFRFVVGMTFGESMLGIVRKARSQTYGIESVPMSGKQP